MKHKKSGNFSFNDWVYSLAVTVRLASWLLAGFVSVVVTLSLTYCVWIMFTYCDEFFPLEPMFGCCGCRKHGGLLCRNVELSKVLSFKLAVGQKIAFHALSTAENSAILIFTLPIHSASFYLQFSSYKEFCVSRTVTLTVTCDLIICYSPWHNSHVWQGEKYQNIKQITNVLLFGDFFIMLFLHLPSWRLVCMATKKLLFSTFVHVYCDTVTVLRSPTRVFAKILVSKDWL